MVSCKLYGGLGNLMFQIAATIATSLKYNIPYCIPKHTLNDEVWKPYHFENVNYCDGKEGVSTAQVWKEPSHAYHEIPKPEHKKFILDGYFQSGLFFKDYLPEIRKAFGFDDLPTNYDMVSIHVRRGDYLKYPTKHPVITLDYLRKAVDFIEGDNHFEIFSDDLEWCKVNLNEDFFNGRSFDYVSIGNEVSDMVYMAMAEHNIISNSTYSLMASILNNNPDKIVISPSRDNWFGAGNSHLDTSTIIPDNYIQIKY